MNDPTPFAGRTEFSERGASFCGISMPLSADLRHSAAHWEEVLGFLLKVVDSAGLQPRLVSSPASDGILQERIMRELLELPLLIFDISGRAPNVMFELGMRLAFNKPAVIIHDHETALSPADCPVVQLEYPADLSSRLMDEFAAALTAHLRAIHDGKPWRIEPKQAPENLTVETSTPVPAESPFPPAVARELAATREALRSFRTFQGKLPAAPKPRPIIELQGWKTSDVQGFVSGVQRELEEAIVVTKSDGGESHFLLLPAGLSPRRLLQHLGNLSGIDSVRLLLAPAEASAS